VNLLAVRVPCAFRARTGRNGPTLADTAWT
jgi:hypothetical protein